ncbi:MAG TPA: transporter [Solimonas sp.]|nr:transporter [Solimonas sp.]
MGQAGLVLAALLALAGTAATASPAAPQMGRYMPLYPGMYLGAAYATDDQDSSFGPDGDEVPTAVPTVSPATAFPEKRTDVSFTWHFPLFETYDLPFISHTTHMARISTGYVENDTEGGLAQFNASERGQDRDQDQADDLRDTGRGIGDLLLEFGSYLYGSPAPQWRTRERTPLAVLLLFGLNLPYGVYDRDSAINAGSNTGYLSGKLGVHWQPWSGGFVDAGFGYRAYLKNQDAAYGALAPTYQGDDRMFDLSIGQRVVRGLYISAFATDRKGAKNGYLNPRFAPNAPAASDAQSDVFPTPGVYFDDGTALRNAGGSLLYFIGQRWQLGVHYTVPLSGRSGQFTLPFTQRSPAGCTPGALTCQTSDAGAVPADGQGATRVFASDSLRFTLNYNFGQGDTFTCTGCKQ